MPNNFAISQVDNFLCDIGGMISDPLDMTRNSEIPLAPLFQRGGILSPDRPTNPRGTGVIGQPNRLI
jgi:hypothetical protein